MIPWTNTPDHRPVVAIGQEFDIDIPPSRDFRYDMSAMEVKALTLVQSLAELWIAFLEFLDSRVFSFADLEQRLGFNDDVCVSAVIGRIRV
jgi:hypothetical protein